MKTLLQHGRISLALHGLRAAGDGRPLLLLHGRGQCAPRAVPGDVAAWPGPIFALDFTGHGESTVPRGGGYSVEILMADADHALAHLGGATLLGRGLGAYVALLLAGARPKDVRGAILCDGPGLAGGGPRPVTPTVVTPPDPTPRAPDPFAMIELARDVRPPDYAASYVLQATQFSELDHPISVCAVERPDWLAAVIEEPGVLVTTIADALARYARVA
ncbi:MAG: alpha/beta hydrolase [Proteobacteria bacterium]|nr:MAG: alpha/beta hydrolase [Pseudomonadota bacterium]